MDSLRPKLCRVQSPESWAVHDSHCIFIGQISLNQSCSWGIENFETCLLSAETDYWSVSRLGFRVRQESQPTSQLTSSRDKASSSSAGPERTQSRKSHQRPAPHLPQLGRKKAEHTQTHTSVRRSKLLQPKGSFACAACRARAAHLDKNPNIKPPVRAAQHSVDCTVSGAGLRQKAHA